MTACPMPPAALPARPGIATALPARLLRAHWAPAPSSGVVVALALTRGGRLIALRDDGGAASWGVAAPGGPWRWHPLPGAASAAGFATAAGRFGAVLASGSQVTWVRAPAGPVRRGALPTGARVRGLAARGGEVRLTGDPASLWSVRWGAGKDGPAGLTLRRLPLPGVAGTPGALVALPHGRWTAVRWLAPGGRLLGTSLIQLGRGTPRVRHVPALAVAALGRTLLVAGGDRARGASIWAGRGSAVPVRALRGAGPIGDPVALTADGVAWAAAAAAGRVEGVTLCGEPRAYRVPLPEDLVLERGTGASARIAWERPAVTALAARGRLVAVALSDGRVGWARR